MRSVEFRKRRIIVADAISSVGGGDGNNNAKLYNKLPSSSARKVAIVVADTIKLSSSNASYLARS